eukprot:6484575-Lingulodinium_polyedra.AAC.1
MHVVVWVCRLESRSWSDVAAKTLSTAAFTSDFGVEFGLGRSRAFKVGDLFPWVGRKASEPTSAAGFSFTDEAEITHLPQAF